MKITIMGYSGSGKSTLARKISEKYNIDVLHLDKIQWLPGWETRSKEEKLSIIGEYLDSHTSWVIDGNYTKYHLDRRLDESDKIILLLFNPIRCYFRAKRRYKIY